MQVYYLNYNKHFITVNKKLTILTCYDNWYTIQEVKIYVTLLRMFIGRFKKLY